MAIMRNNRKEKFARTSMVSFSVFIIILGATSLYAGYVNPINWWYGKLFGPAFILVGFLMLYVTFFKWEEMSSSKESQPKKKLKRKTKKYKINTK